MRSRCECLHFLLSSVAKAIFLVSMFFTLWLAWKIAVPVFFGSGTALAGAEEKDLNTKDLEILLPSLMAFFGVISDHLRRKEEKERRARNIVNKTTAHLRGACELVEKATQLSRVEYEAISNAALDRLQNILADDVDNFCTAFIDTYVEAIFIIKRFGLCSTRQEADAVCAELKACLIRSSRY